jgi:hypothetical protein
MDNDLVMFVTARLSDWESGTVDDPLKDDGGRCEYLLGWHFEPDEMRRLISSLRHLLWMANKFSTQNRTYLFLQLADIWHDHADYKPEWAPEGAPDGT